MRPVVVWNITKRCNLRCIHCYIDASKATRENELTTEEAKLVIEDLAEFGVPVILFSGGEPLLRKDLFELGRYAREKGIRTVISTNGTLITSSLAKKIKESGFLYVGISLDGLEKTNDKFRKQKGAFNKTLSGIRNCKKNGLRAGLRFTINKYNVDDLAGIFDLIEREDIQRACFYHLVYSGRGSKMINDDLTHRRMRKTIDLILERTKKLCFKNIEILTVDNHADGVYIYLKLRREDPEKAKEALKLLKINAGNKSGIGIASIDNLGYVYVDQFLRNHPLGNIRERKFSQIWMDEDNRLLKDLRNRLSLLKGKCARCNFQDICYGNFRARAEAVYHDLWQEDPACYLTEDEILTKREDK
jgi:radical SAM protein with 4Fe4S-binding SPASM domain